MSKNLMSKYIYSSVACNAFLTGFSSAFLTGGAAAALAGAGLSPPPPEEPSIVAFSKNSLIYNKTSRDRLQNFIHNRLFVYCNS